MSPGLKDPRPHPGQSQQQSPQEPAVCYPDLEISDAPPLVESEDGGNSPDLKHDNDIKSASSSPPATPTEPPSLDLATPTPSQSASPTRECDHYEKYLMNYETTEKNVYTPVNDGDDAPINDNKTLNSLLSAGNSIESKTSDNSRQLLLMRSVIQTQFDLEILLKHRELRGIDDEIAKIHVMMLQIKRLCQNPKRAIASHEPPEFAEFYAHYLETKKPSTQKYASTDPSTSHVSVGNSVLYPPKILRSSSFSTSHLDAQSKPHTRQQTIQLSQNNPPHKPKCIIRRNDGVLVKLVCPKCLRENFGSAQGFINHCRISHSLEYTTHDAAAIVCGVEVEEQDGIGLEAQQRNSEITPIPESVQAAPVKSSAAITPPETAAPVAEVPAVGKKLPFMPCTANAVNTKNLSFLVKKRRMGQDIDVHGLALKSVEKFAKGHLLEEEEEEEDTEKLGDEATPFERALAEAKKLKLDVDEIRRTAPDPSAASGSTSKSGGRKKRGGARNRRASNRVSSTGAPAGPRVQAAPPVLPPLMTRSMSASSVSSPATPTPGTVGGKYRPGFAPSHWSHLGKKEDVLGKTLPGQPSTPATTPVSQQKRVPSIPTMTRSKSKAGDAPHHTVGSRSTMRTSSAGSGASFDDEEVDEGDGNEEVPSSEDDDMEEDDEEIEEDEDTVMENTKGVHHFRTPQRSTGKTLPGSRSGQPATPVDSLKKFIPLSRFF